VCALEKTKPHIEEDKRIIDSIDIIDKILREFYSESYNLHYPHHNESAKPSWLQNVLLSKPYTAFTSELAFATAMANTYDSKIVTHTNEFGKDTTYFSCPDTRVSDHAIDLLCNKSESPVTTNILHLVANKSSAIIHNWADHLYPNLIEKIDFSEQQKKAIDELLRRGNPPYQPLFFIDTNAQLEYINSKIEVLKSPSFSLEIRKQAAVALCRTGIEYARQALVEAINYSDGNLKAAISLGLCVFGDSSAVNSITADKLAVRNLIMHLKANDDQVIYYLTLISKDSEKDTRFSALIKLSKIFGGERALTLLQESLKIGEQEDRLLVIDTLLDVCKHLGVGTLISLAKDPNKTVRMHATKALIKENSIESRSAVADIIAVETDEQIKQQIELAVRNHNLMQRFGRS
jgi:hypothetical protein